jgi:hypothetical protein
MNDLYRAVLTAYELEIAALAHRKAQDDVLCPHAPGTPQYEEWILGWNFAHGNLDLQQRATLESRIPALLVEAF